MISDWLEGNIDDCIRYTGNSHEAHFNCPICSDTRHRMYVNLSSGAVYCHNCGFSGTIVNLIQQVDGIPYSSAYSKFNDIKGSLQLPEVVTSDSIEQLFMSHRTSTLAKRAIPLPDEYEPIDPSTRNLRVRRAIRYLHSRGVTDRQITQYKMGYCYDGVYAGRVIIPITEHGELRFWVARAVSRDAYRKEMSPSNQDYQISKSEVVFNLDRAASRYHSIVISEGIFDALAWGGIGVSMLGKSMYTAQFSMLMDYRGLLTEGVYISLDADAHKDAMSMAERLSDYFDVFIVNIPRELDDPNNVLVSKGRGYLMNLLAGAEHYSEFTQLKYLLGG